jgi:hypothetical protein
MTQIPHIKKDFILKFGHVPYVYGINCDEFYILK